MQVLEKLMNIINFNFLLNNGEVKKVLLYMYKNWKIDTHPRNFAMSMGKLMDFHNKFTSALKIKYICVLRIYTYIGETF